MNQDELTVVISQTAALMEQFERRCDHLGGHLQALVQDMNTLAGQLPAIVSQSADASLHTLPAQVVHQARTGLEQAAHGYQERLRASGGEVADSTRVLAGQIRRMEKLHRHLIWKIVGATSLCFALLLAGGIWLSLHYTKVIERNQLSAQLMKAYNEADVNLCGGQLCARVDPKSRRFGDHKQYVLVLPR